MAKIRYAQWQIDHFMDNEEGRKYLEYNSKVGGEPIGLLIPIGHPYGVEEMGGVIAVYDECIRRNIKWEDLLDFHPPEDVIF